MRSILIILTILTAPWLSWASADVLGSSQCVEAFDSRNNFGAPDDQRNEKALLAILAESHKATSLLSPDVLRKIDNKNFNSALTAPLGLIFDIEENSETKTLVKQIKSDAAARLKLDTEAKIRSYPKQVIPEFEKLLADSFRIEKLPDKTIMISFNMLPKIGFARILRERLANYYLNTAQFIYMLSGLEPNDAMTGMKMIDEITVYANKGMYFDFHMVFDEKVWAIHKLVMQDYWLENRSKDHNFGDWGHFLPLLPVTGSVNTMSLVRSSEPVEIKRYFQNDDEDPLNLLSLTKKHDYLVRTSMLAEITKSLPEESVVTVHAHQKKQMIAYRRLGFHQTAITENPKYPGIPIYILEAKREELLKANQALMVRIRGSVSEY